MDAKTNVLNLYKDADLKECYKLNFKNASGVISDALLNTEWNHSFRYLVENINHPFDPALSLSKVNPIHLRMALLELSALGLSLNQNSKQAYISTEYSTSGKLLPKLIIGYRGMQELIFRTKKIKNFAVQLVRDGDNFTWFGATEAPIFSSTLNNVDKAIIAGFVKFEFWDGCIFCVSMTGIELNTIADEQVKKQIDMYGNADNCLYAGAWRSLMLTICLRRFAFKEIESFLRQRDIVLYSTNELSVSTDDDLLLDFERQLNEKVS